MARPVLVRDARTPELLALAGHPLRWRLLNELVGSDRQVSELVDRVKAPQNLVSYHLAQLRAGGLARARRSSADGRSAYYTADLDRCAALLNAAGAAMHPALGLVPPAPAPPEAMSGRVLFLCTGNSARSQMAEAFLQHAAGDHVHASSAGSHPTRLHPNAVKAMRGYGIDLAGRRAKHFDELTGQRFDYVITLCDRVREICPEFPGPARAIHWSMPNPAEAGDSDPATYPAFERAAREIAMRVRFLIPLLTHDKEVR